MRKYNQLTVYDRDKIAVLRANGFNLSDIARLLGRNRSTISREIKRNSSSQYECYTPHRAQERSEHRKRLANTHQRLKNDQIRTYVETCLKDDHSPEQIAGSMRIKHPALRISHEAIYQYIYSDKPDLKQYLARHYRVRKKRKAKNAGTVKAIPNRVDISQRPKDIERRLVIGHWESDTVVSRQSKVALAVSVERKSRLTKIVKIQRRSSEKFSKAVIDSLGKVPKHQRLTITYDNGKENVDHEKINQALNVQSYFCLPYHSWEKGTVENTIGLIRRYFPKKTDFAKITENQIREVERKLNSRPRKCLGFRTPAEVFS